jgi:hypothetical protein
MKIWSFSVQPRHFLMALALASLCTSSALAQNHSHSAPGQDEVSADSQPGTNQLIKTVRDATARFQSVSQAEREGYHLQFGCVTGDSGGAMGLHYVNGDLVQSGVIDASHPQIVIYEPTANGRLHITGADFLVLKDVWDAHHSGPPELMGQLFHLFDSPNRFGLPPFYTLHVWAWKDNPNGAFVNWHPNVSCKLFNPHEN